MSSPTRRPSLRRDHHQDHDRRLTSPNSLSLLALMVPEAFCRIPHTMQQAFCCRSCERDMSAGRGSQCCFGLREAPVESGRHLLSLPSTVLAALPVLPFTSPNFTPFFCRQKRGGDDDVGRSVGRWTCVRRARRRNYDSWGDFSGRK